MSNQIKVTECWTVAEDGGDGPPSAQLAGRVLSLAAFPAVLMWKEDYDALVAERDAMLKELEVFRKKEKVAQHISDFINKVLMY